ncbi:ROK family protein [Flavitalea flava]
MEKVNASIGIDLGGTNVRAGLVSDGQIVRTASVRIAGLKTEEEVFDRIYSCIGEIMEGTGAKDVLANGMSGEGPGKFISGIGIGVPSIVDAKKGIVYDTVNIPSWKEVPCKEILEAKYSVPVWVNNDANCFALGEKYYGAGKDCDNLVGVTIGTGIGTGIVIGGRLFNGAHCGAGEIGYIAYKDVHFEHYSSGQYFMNTHHRAGEELLKEAIAGDTKAKDIFLQYGRHLGHALLAILYAYDPEMIVLGGSVSQAFPFFEKSMWESLQESLFPHALKDLKVVPSAIKDVAILGASLLNKDRQLF